MADQARTARAQSQPDGQFAPPCGCSGEQQICRVGAGDQQNHAYRAKQGEQHSPARSNHLAIERNHFDLPAPMVVVLALDPGHNRIQLRLSFDDRHAGFEPGNALDVMRGAIRRISLGEGAPDIYILAIRERMVIVARMVRARRHHANDRIGLIVEHDPMADDISGCAKAGAPKAVA